MKSREGGWFVENKTKKKEISSTEGFKMMNAGQTLGTGESKIIRNNLPKVYWTVV